MHLTPNMYKIVTLKANAKKVITLKCMVQKHTCKTITLKANAKEIITLKCIWHHICTKSLLWRQMLRNHYFKMHGAKHTCKTITLKENAKEIITLKCIWHQMCTKLLLWRQMLRKLLLQNACGTTYVQNHYFEGKCSGNYYFEILLMWIMYKIITLKANAK